MSDITTVLLDKVAEEGRSHWLPEYQEKQTKANCLGVELSSYFKWNGLQILETAYAALEDANFHKENEVIAELIARVKQEFQA